MVGEEHGGKVPSIVGDVVQDQPMGRQELQVEIHVVAHHGALFYKLLEFIRDGAEEGRARNLVRGYSGEPLDEVRDIAARVNESLERVYNLVSLELDRAHFDYGVAVFIQPGGFQVQCNADLIKASYGRRYQRHTCWSCRLPLKFPSFKRAGAHHISTKPCMAGVLRT